MKKTVILIPALDPPKQFTDYIRDLQTFGFDDFIIVDDGSSDKTCFEELRNMGLTVLVHAQNEGKGQGLKTGLEYYRTHFDPEQYCGVITADSDGQHLCRDVKKISDRLCEGKDQLILGVRDFSLPQVPPKSRYGNQTTAWIFRWMLGLKISDTQTGLRGIPNALVEECLLIPGSRFEYETTMLIELGKKYGICEIPITTVYYEENKGTHFHPIRDSIRIYRTIFGTFFRYLFTSLSSAVLDILLFALFSGLLFRNVSGRIFLATGLARVCSAIYNFCMNRNLVFKSNVEYGTGALRYGVLCVLQATVSAGLVNGLYHLTGSGEVLWKIIVDTLLFFASYQIQKRFIFNRKGKRK